MSTNHPTTPPVNPDLSRHRLRQLARWIRDELDLRVAREGPDILRPDDVLTLHETFIALRHAQNFTISDLRATGIHKAIQDISGVATRWPGRLCDDCDKIIDIWTVKFGPFSEIHPFLYGRGGRLEGIASIHEHSREALLKRWATSCPEKIHPKRSHTLGDLGFKAGQWWINPLFAHHAGIIGLEACEGGTTYDKHGAYALLLKDTGEIEASSEERFTYRVPQNDKGKFRLTSATPKSRDPVRVLRSHSINSVWGPKAGVRYEGCYSVKGWSIKQAKSSDMAGGQWKESDILFDVHFERNDPTPMEEVTKRPTATEVDDYAEYKRLRKISRDGKRGIGPSAPESKLDHPTPVVKAAPPIMPVPGPLAAVKTLQTDVPPRAPRKGIFKHLHFDEEAHVHFPMADEVVSPKTISADADPLNLATMKSNTLHVPAHPIRTNTQGKADASFSESRGRASPVGSNSSSAHTAASTVPAINIREVAPWIDYDVGLTVPSPPPPDDDTAVRHERPVITQSSFTMPGEKDKDTDTKSIKAARSQNSVHSQGHGPESPSPVNEYVGGRHGRRKSGDSKGLGTTLSPEGKRETRKSIFVKGRHPTGKLFDGADEDEDGFWLDGQTAARTISFNAGPTTPKTMQVERLAYALRHYGTIPWEPHSPDVPYNMARRDAICLANADEVASIFATVSEPEAVPGIDPPVLVVVQHEDPFIEAPAPLRPPPPKALPNPEEVASIFTAAPTTTLTEPSDPFVSAPSTILPEALNTITPAPAPTVAEPINPTNPPPAPSRPPKPKARPMAMRNLITASRTATPLGSPVSTPFPIITSPILERPAIATAKPDNADNSLAEAKLRGMLEQIKALDVKVMFRDPFGSPVVGRDGCPIVRSRKGSAVAPDVVVDSP